MPGGADGIVLLRRDAARDFDEVLYGHADDARQAGSKNESNRQCTAEDTEQRAGIVANAAIQLFKVHMHVGGADGACVENDPGGDLKAVVEKLMSRRGRR